MYFIQGLWTVSKLLFGLTFTYHLECPQMVTLPVGLIKDLFSARNLRRRRDRRSHTGNKLCHVRGIIDIADKIVEKSHAITFKRSQSVMHTLKFDVLLANCQNSLPSLKFHLNLCRALAINLSMLLKSHDRKSFRYD